MSERSNLKFPKLSQFCGQWITNVLFMILCGGALYGIDLGITKVMALW